MERIPGAHGNDRLPLVRRTGGDGKAVSAEELPDPHREDRVLRMSHANNPDILKRLRRAEGHLSSVTRMVAEGRDGIAIAQQMQAVIRALEKAKQMLIHDHIDHHLGEVAGPLPAEARQRLAELREIAKYL